MRYTRFLSSYNILYKARRGDKIQLTGIVTNLGPPVKKEAFLGPSFQVDDFK
jgi:hypothetical protein